VGGADKDEAPQGEIMGSGREGQYVGALLGRGSVVTGRERIYDREIVLRRHSTGNFSLLETSMFVNGNMMVKLERGGRLVTDT